MHNFFKILFSLIFLATAQIANSDDQILSEQSIISPLAINSLLLDSDQSDLLSIVVGERGHVLYTNDNKSWMQAIVETKATLTNVFILDENTALAVGHDAVILKSNDGARTWRKVFSDIKEEAPLLDLYFKDKSNGIAIGAYSLMYVTEDGGLNWEKTELNISDKDKNNDESEYTGIYDFHLNAIASAGDSRLYIAAEAGHILRSDDEGNTWAELPSPYRGSFFGVLPLSFNEVLVYGLRGHLYRSSDAGNSWEKIETGTKQMLTDARVLSNGDIIVVGLAGTLLYSKNNGATFGNVDLQQRYDLSSMLETDDKKIILTSDTGVHILFLDSFVIEQ